ncbi:RagB/SusD family nutrient uptake outer membrane protein [Chitinophaga cymbidii]|uniref:RagB/SusD family nutrient uptake outer membrane protein n=1 Tax=Chitinophaga cymbidii TaxID=1096750 RepID=A0A512RPA9_9BACT|nr:RagB/SusD family nutrient uptake outer membrane protein [Chitinophaga cymbidii]GEP97529.1 hypothetical protein CCY01nite_37890 [Chitinophaga cymbidii]
MKKKIFTILALSCFLFQSCEKMLEIVPASTSPEELILSTVDGMDGGLNYAYAQLHTDVGRHYTLWSEALADHLVIRGSAIRTQMSFYDRDMDAIVTETISATDLRLQNDIRMRELYNCINAAALILRAAENDLAKDDLGWSTNKARIMGECHFLRAAAHFELVRFWAKPWDATPDNTHPGIVLMDHPVDDRVSNIKPRATLKEIYDFVIAEFKKAEEQLPEAFDPAQHAAVFNGRATKDAARGYLAKVYFQQLNSTMAKQTIDGLIGATPGIPSSHPLQASLSALFSARGADDTDPECIYQSTSSITTNSLAPYWNSTNTESIYTINNAAPKGIVSEKFLADANYSASDLRWTTFFKTLADGKVTPIKYSLVQHYNIPLIRTAELLLDRAEINAAANNLPDAIADCNAIRERAQIPLLDDGISQAALLDTIKLERIRELAFEGDRLHNLRRMKVPIPAGDRADQTPLPWNGLELVLKYSVEDMARNPLLDNNY